jgi:hypothetical protein
MFSIHIVFFFFQEEEKQMKGQLMDILREMNSDITKEEIILQVS